MGKLKILRVLRNFPGYSDKKRMLNLVTRFGTQSVKSAPLADTVLCNICGGTKFKPGPLGRLHNGKPPRCTQCRSLERHRLIRRAWHMVAGLIPLSTYSCLQFARDICVEPDWFKTYDHSEYGGHNSLDLQNIALPDAAVDVIVCNHVLEHVADDAKALRELMRILTPRGILQLTVPLPLQNEHTSDWGYPKEEEHGHYRIYGADIVELFQRALPGGGHLLSIVAEDDVTGMRDIVFFLSKSAFLSKMLAVTPSLFFKTL